MWMPVYMSKKDDDIRLIRNLLKENSIIVSVRKCDDYHEILVPSCELAEAQRIIIEASV